MRLRMFYDHDDPRLMAALQAQRDLFDALGKIVRQTDSIAARSAAYETYRQECTAVLEARGIDPDDFTDWLCDRLVEKDQKLGSR